MKRSQKNLILIVLLGLVLGFVIIAAGIRRTVHEAYAAEWVGGHIVRFMETNAGAWPGGWADLEPIHAKSESPFSFEMLQKYIIVDWQADPAELANRVSTNDPPFEVVRGRNGIAWQATEPNTIIKKWLDANKPIVEK